MRDAHFPFDRVEIPGQIFIEAYVIAPHSHLLYIFPIFMNEYHTIPKKKSP